MPRPCGNPAVARKRAAVRLRMACSQQTRIGAPSRGRVAAALARRSSVSRIAPGMVPSSAHSSGLRTSRTRTDPDATRSAAEATWTFSIRSDPLVANSPSPSIRRILPTGVAIPRGSRPRGRGSSMSRLLRTKAAIFPGLLLLVVGQTVALEAPLSRGSFQRALKEGRACKSFHDIGPYVAARKSLEGVAQAIVNNAIESPDNSYSFVTVRLETPYTRVRGLG